MSADMRKWLSPLALVIVIASFFGSLHRVPRN